MAFTRSGVRSPSPPPARRGRRVDGEELFGYSWQGCKTGEPDGRGYAPTRLPVSPSRRLVFAGIAQLVEHNLAKVGVAGSSPVSRSAGRTVGESDRRTVR